jgi:hypothetical protein
MFQTTHRVQTPAIQRAIYQQMEEMFIPAKIEESAEQAGKTI